MMLYVFIHSLIGKIYKILTLKEESDAGRDVHWLGYVESLSRDMVGACSTFYELSVSPDYITVLNILEYMQVHEVDHRICKQEVFKMIRLLENLEKQIGGDACV